MNGPTACPGPYGRNVVDSLDSAEIKLPGDRPGPTKVYGAEVIGRTAVPSRIERVSPRTTACPVRVARVLSSLGLLWVFVSACSDLGPGNMPVIDSTVVASADVVVRIDPLRTYEFDLNLGRVDSVLTALWSTGLRIDEAWMPLNYLCEDIRGPRLTVALEAPDDRMADHDFRLGTGRLACSEQLRQYVIGRAPGSFRVSGTVRFIGIEGGCWVIRVNESLQYQPVGLPDAFRVDGVDVRALLTLEDDMASICMTGRIAQVLEIELR
jgi:hypothetical protein